VNADLHQPAGSQAIFLRRVLCGDGVPIAIQDTILPERSRPAIDGTVLEGGSLHEALARTGSVPYHAWGTLVAESADPELAHLLDVAVGSALLVQRQLVNDAEENPIQLVTTHFVGERFVFDVDQYRDLDRTTDDVRGGPPYQIESL
jgi:GntR family transcriptional regulator